MKKIFLVPYGGLGNQLFQIAAAMSLSEGGSVVVLSEWGFGRLNQKNEIEIQSLLWPSRICFDNSSNIAKISKRFLNLLLRLGSEDRFKITLKIMEKIATGYFAFTLRARIQTRINRGLGISVLGIKNQTLLIGYFQGISLPNAVKRDLLKLKISSFSNYGMELINKVKQKKIVIVHVRRGDYVNEAFGLLENNYYKRALSLLSDVKFEEIWVFSDDVESAKEIEVFNTYKRTIFVDDKGLESAEILEIMRYGVGYIIANSSFSWWAAYLRHQDSAPVVYPEPWFKFQKSPKHIAESGWIQVDW